MSAEPQVEPIWKEPTRGACGCGCGKEGRFRRPWRDGAVCVVGCPCRRCLGARSKRKGGRKQSKAVNALGIPRSSLSPGHEEFLGGAIRVEVKSGAQIKPAMTAYLKMEDQSEAQRPYGDHRPFAGIAMPDGSSDGIVMVRLSRLSEFVAGYAENWGTA